MPLSEIFKETNYVRHDRAFANFDKICLNLEFKRI